MRSGLSIKGTIRAMVEMGEDDFRGQPAARQIPQRGQERVQPRLVLGRGHPVVPVSAKSALNANHTASRTKLASHAQRANDVPVNFS
jgi:hypothetical protein